MNQKKYKIEELKRKSNENQKLLLNKIKNGRVNIMGDSIETSEFPLYEQNNNGNLFYKNEALKSIQTNTELSNLFFSSENIKNLQITIRYRVWIRSKKKYLIGDQSENELKLIMRSIFLQNGKFNNNNIINQIKELNELVCNYSVSNITSNIEMYLAYKNTVSYLPKPLLLPKNVSIKGTK